MLDAGRRNALPDLIALVCVAPERFLAYDVLARFGGGNSRLTVKPVGAGIVEQRDASSRTTSRQSVAALAKP